MSHFLVRASWSAVVLMLLFSLAGSPLVYSQGEQAIPIGVGENKIGEILTADQVLVYEATVMSPQTLDIQVLAVTQGFAPALRIFDPSGMAIRAAANPDFEATVRITALEVSTGLYRLEVRSANGQPGQFVISVQAGEALPAPMPLIPGEAVSGEVRSAAPQQRYSFSGSETDALLLHLDSLTAGAAPVVTLKDADTLQTLATTGERVTGLRLHLPAGVFHYLVEVAHSGAPVAEAYALCLEIEGGPACQSAPGATPVPTPTMIALAPSPTPLPSPLPALPATGPCVVASLQGGAVNVRSGPGTSYSVIGYLSGDAVAAVIGRLPDGSWFQVGIAGGVGWVSASVVRSGGQCGSVPIVAPTATPTETQPPPLVPSPTVVPIAVPTLDFSLPPNYGSLALTSGFAPDPYLVGGITSGGSIDVSYLGGGCVGFATEAPDLSVHFTPGAWNFLRFYFVGNGDAALVINSPNGSYYCVDDSFGTTWPTIDFYNPEVGRYDIWVTSYAPGTYLNGTLYITESETNHP